MTGAIPVKKGRKIVLVISGGNVDSPLLGRIIRKGMVKNGRIMRIRLNLADVPGALSRLLGRIADAGANVLHIYHDRDVKDMPVYMTTVITSYSIHYTKLYEVRCWAGLSAKAW